MGSALCSLYEIINIFPGNKLAVGRLRLLRKFLNLEILNFILATLSTFLGILFEIFQTVGSSVSVIDVIIILLANMLQLFVITSAYSFIYFTYYAVELL